MQPRTLRDPHSILIYMLTCALGFSTVENILYVCSGDLVGMPRGFLEAIFIACGRAFMSTPIHATCACMTAAQLIKRDLTQQPMHGVLVLLPAVLFHGTFDLTAFLVTSLLGNTSVAGFMTLLSLSAAMLLSSCIYLWVMIRRLSLCMQYRSWAHLDSTAACECALSVPSANGGDGIDNA